MDIKGLKVAAIAAVFLAVILGFIGDRNNTVVTLGEQGSTGQRGDVRLIEGSNITITQDNAASTITLAASG